MNTQQITRLSQLYGMLRSALIAAFLLLTSILALGGATVSSQELTPPITETPTLTPTWTPELTQTPSATATLTETPTATAIEPSASPSPTPTVDPLLPTLPTYFPSATPSLTPSATLYVEATAEITETPQWPITGTAVTLPELESGPTPIGQMPPMAESLLFPAALPVTTVTIANNSAADLINTLQTANPATCTHHTVINLPANADFSLTAARTLSASDPLYEQGNNGLPTIRCEVTINGSNTTIQRSTSTTAEFRIFGIASGGILRLNGVIVRNGYVDRIGGGGIFSNGGALYLTNSVVEDNVVEYIEDDAQILGGGVYVYNGFLRVESSVIQDNSNVSANALGGGIAVIGSDAEITRSDIRNNSADDLGGGVIFWFSGDDRVTNSCFAANTPHGVYSNRAMNVEYNWWNSTLGPIVEGVSNSQRDSFDTDDGDPVDYEPYAQYPLGCGLNASTVTPTPTPSATGGGVVYRVNAGGPTLTTGGKTWYADNFFVSGATTTRVTAINGTTDDALYQTYRLASTDTTGFEYRFPLPNGTYTVNLHFAELYFTGESGRGPNGSGRRVFDVQSEGFTVIDDLDLNAVVAPKTAYVRSFVIGVSDGVLNLIFPPGTANRPLIQAIEILQAQVATPTPTPTRTPTATVTRTPTPTRTPSPDGSCNDSSRTLDLKDDWQIATMPTSGIQELLDMGLVTSTGLTVVEGPTLNARRIGSIAWSTSIRVLARITFPQQGFRDQVWYRVRPNSVANPTGWVVARYENVAFLAGDFTNGDPCAAYFATPPATLTFTYDRRAAANYAIEQSYNNNLLPDHDAGRRVSRRLGTSNQSGLFIPFANFSYSVLTGQPGQTGSNRVSDIHFGSHVDGRATHDTRCGRCM